MKRIIQTLLLLFITGHALAQSEYIYTTWVSEGQMDCSDNTYVKTEDPNKWLIEFNRDGTASIRSKYMEREVVQPFKVEDNLIKTEYRNLRIHAYRNDSLWLEETMEDSCSRLLMISRNLIAQKQKQMIIPHKGDSVYFPEFGNSPEINNNANYEPYLRSRISKELRGMSEVQINLSFIVTRNGDISNIKLVVNKEKYREPVMNVLKETENDWTPMQLDGEPVNALVQVKFKYQYN
jgi:hypothetical protein